MLHPMLRAYSFRCCKASPAKVTDQISAGKGQRTGPTSCGRKTHSLVCLSHSTILLAAVGLEYAHHVPVVHGLFLSPLANAEISTVAGNHFGNAYLTTDALLDKPASNGSGHLTHVVTTGETD